MRRHLKCHPFGSPLLILAAAVGAAACDGEPVLGPPVLACIADRDCVDGDLCNGLERCVAGRCAEGRAGASERFICDVGGAAVVECAEDAPCGQPLECPAPSAPVVGFVPRGLQVPIRWSGDGAGLTLEAAVASPGGLPVEWQGVVGGSVDLDALAAASTAGPRDTDAPVSLWLRSDSGCEDAVHIADFGRGPVVPPAAPEGATREDAPVRAQVAASDARIIGWAVDCVDLRPGDRVDPAWMDPRLALGPAGHDPYDVLTLGEGGEATFALPFAVADGPGPELAVFENAVPDDFIELARVEVSTDGVHFVAFDTLSLTESAVAAYDRMDPAQVDGFAGPAPLGHGIAFDLGRLTRHPAVLSGRVDLGAVRFVRIVDIVGDGSVEDSFGHPVWDPFPTWGSAGFDLDAIAVLSPEDGPAEEPAGGH